MSTSIGLINGRPLSSPSAFSSESTSPTSPIETGCCRYPRSRSVNSLFNHKHDKTKTNSIKRLPKFTWAIFRGRDKTKKPKDLKIERRQPVQKVTSWQYVQPDSEIDIPITDKPLVIKNHYERTSFDSRTVLAEQRIQNFIIVPTNTPSSLLRVEPSAKTQTSPKSLRRRVLDRDLSKKQSTAVNGDVPRSPGPLDGSLYTQVKKRKPGETDESDDSNSSLSLNRGYHSADEFPNQTSPSIMKKNDPSSAHKDDMQTDNISGHSGSGGDFPPFMTSSTHEYEELIHDAEVSVTTSKYTVNDIANALEENDESHMTSLVVTSQHTQEEFQIVMPTNVHTRPEIIHDYEVTLEQDEVQNEPKVHSFVTDHDVIHNDVITNRNIPKEILPIHRNEEGDKFDIPGTLPQLGATEYLPDCSSVNVNESTPTTSQLSAAKMFQPSPSNHLTQLDVDNAMALVNECLADTEERGYEDTTNLKDLNGNTDAPQFSPAQPDYPALTLDPRFEEKGPEYALPVRDVVLGTIPARKAVLVTNKNNETFLMNQADLVNNNNPTDLKNVKFNDDSKLDGSGYSTIEDINTVSNPVLKQLDHPSLERNSDVDSGIDGSAMVHTTSTTSDINTSDVTSSVASFNHDKKEPETSQTWPQVQSTLSSPSLTSPTLTNTSETMGDKEMEQDDGEDEEEKRVREEIENMQKKLQDLQNKHNTLKRRKEETKRHSLGYKISQTNDSTVPTLNHVISATLPRPPGHRSSQPNSKSQTGHLSDKEQQEIDDLLRSVQELDIMTSQQPVNDVITTTEPQNFPSPETTTMVTTALAADPVTLQNNNYPRYHDNTNMGSSSGVFTPAYAHPMHQPKHMERQHLQTQLQLQKQEENARKQQQEEFERQQRALEYENQKLLQEQRQREYNRQKELDQQRRNQYESHLLIQKQQEREFLIQEEKRQAEREKQEQFQLQFEQKQKILQEKQQYVTQPPPAPRVDRFPKDEIESKAKQLEVQRRTSLSMEALDARVAVASQPQLVTAHALGKTSQPVKADELQSQLDELDQYILQLTQPYEEPAAETVNTTAPPKRNSDVVKRNRRSFTVELERKMDPNIPLSPGDLVNSSHFAKEEPPRPPLRSQSSYNSVSKRLSQGFDLAQTIQTDDKNDAQVATDKHDDVFSPLNSPNPSYPPQSSRTRPPQQQVAFTPLQTAQPPPPPKKSGSLEERLSPELFLAMAVNPGGRPVENVHSYKEDHVQENRLDVVDSAPPQTPGFPVTPKTPYVNLTSPVPGHVPIGLSKTPLSALGLKPNEHPQRAIDDVSSSDSDVTNNKQDRSPLGSDTRRQNQMNQNNHVGSPLNTSPGFTNGYNNQSPTLGIKETTLLASNPVNRLEEQQQASLHQAYTTQPQENFHGYNSQPQSYPTNNNNPHLHQQQQQNGWLGNNNKGQWIQQSNGHSPHLTPTSAKSFSTPNPASSLGSGGVSPFGSRSLTGSNDSLLSDGSAGSHNISSSGGVYTPQRHPSLPPKESSMRNSGSSLRSTSTAGSGYLGGASQTSPQSAGSAGSPVSSTGHYPFTQTPLNRRESQLSAYERHGFMHHNISSDDGGLSSPASGRTSTSSISDIDKLAHELSLSSLSGTTPPKFIRDTTSYWYKPDITREQALAMLRERSAGSFVVRNSRCYPGAFGLALKVAQVPQAVLATAKPGTNMSDELVRHFLIEPSSRGVKLKGCANEPVFGSLSALIYQHSITPLALPCKLIISTENQVVPQPSGSGRNSAEVSNSAAELLRQGAACNVLYLGSADTESLTGPEAIERAMRERMQNRGQAVKTSVVHFKVSPQGITLTDNARKIFFRRHYATSSVTYCGLDPSARDPHNRRWDASGDRGPPNARVFAFVAKKTGNSAVNVCHLFAELDLEQPAPAIVNFVSKVLIGNSSGN